MERLVRSASASCLMRLGLDTTPRLRLSCARDVAPARARQMRPKSRSHRRQPRSESRRTALSRRPRQMSRTSAPDSGSPEIWMELGSMVPTTGPWGLAPVSRPGHKLARLRAGAGRGLRSRSRLGSQPERRRRQPRLWWRRSEPGAAAGGSESRRRSGMRRRGGGSGAGAGAARGPSCSRPALVLSLAASEAAPALPAPGPGSRARGDSRGGMQLGFSCGAGAGGEFLWQRLRHWLSPRPPARHGPRGRCAVRVLG